MINRIGNAIYYTALVSITFLISCAENNQSTKIEATDIKAGPTVSQTLRLQHSIQLPEVKGGFDLMAIDLKGMRLFLDAEDNHSVEVIDLKNNKPLISLPGFDEPKWAVFRPETNRLYIATGGDAKVTVLDATTFKKIKSFSFKEKCNNLRLDTTNQCLYVGVGSTFGAIGIIDVKIDKIVNEIPLSDFPKQFELDGNRTYVNIPSKNRIDVVDRSLNKVIDIWPVNESTENVPMALDKIQHRLFVACEPGKFIVFNTETGKSFAAIDINKAADGIYFDAGRSLIYVSCGEGFIDVIQQMSANEYLLVDKIKTIKGAGTSLFSPSLNQLFLAVPHTETNAAELRIYNTTN